MFVEHSGPTSKQEDTHSFQVHMKLTKISHFLGRLKSLTQYT